MHRYFIIAAVFFLAGSLCVSPAAVFAQSKAEQSKILQLRKQTRQEILDKNRRILNEEKEKLSSINRKEQELARQLKSAEANLWDVEESIRSIAYRRERVDDSIAILEADIANAKTDFAEKQRLLGVRLRNLYKNRDINYLSALLESENFSDFISRMDFFKRMIQADLALIDDIRNKRIALEQEEARMAELKRTLAADEAEYRKKQMSMQKIRSERNSILQEVEQQRGEVAQSVYELETLTREMEVQLENIIRQEQELNYGKPAVRGEGHFVWPVTGIITSDYGYRIHPIYGRRIFHSGLDIGAPYGIPIRASASGSVIYSGWYSGYGNTVILDHGDGYSTLYAHCSVLYVAKGQRVSQGHAIASVGSTGNSTGPHLHFEIRYRGSPIDPRSRL